MKAPRKLKIICLLWMVCFCQSRMSPSHSGPHVLVSTLRVPAEHVSCIQPRVDQQERGQLSLLGGGVS